MKTKISNDRAYFMPWKTVEHKIGRILEKLFFNKFTCMARRSHNFMSVIIKRDKPNEYDLSKAFSSVNILTDEELAVIFEIIELPEKEWQMCSIINRRENELSHSICEGLLRMDSDIKWQKSFAGEDGLYLFGVEDNAKSEVKIRIGCLNLSLSELKGKDELLAYLAENDPTHTALMDFCQDYRDKYHNELCWNYPISDGKHLGTFMVLVKEGILSLPYDSADETDYEQFCLDDVCMFNIESLRVFMEDWKSFNTDLENAMHSMKLYLTKRSCVDENKTISD